MPGQHDLDTLLGAMAPALRAEDYVFCTLPHGAQIPGGGEPFATVCEDEGLTVVIERRHADGLECSAPFRAITLTVHSSLDAVGFIAAVTRALADMGISANVLAGYHHDHVLVPADRADEALRVLETLARL